jgi:hypothetical protein
VLPCMEEVWELGSLLFDGDHTCLEEGAHLAGRSYSWRKSYMSVSMER